MIQKVTRWWWIRHAPVLDMEGILYGSADVPCDTSNLKAFDQLTTILPSNALWIRSNLMRTHQTSEAIRKVDMAIPKPKIERALTEQNFGNWQGLSWKQMEKLDEQAYKTFWERPARNRPPGGESFSDQIKRVSKIINRITEENLGLEVVAVAHGGTIRAALCHAIGLTPEVGMSFKVDNLSITCLEHVSGGLLKGRGGLWRVVYVNRPPV